MNPKNIKVGDKLVWLDPDNITSQIVTVDFIDEDEIQINGVDSQIIDCTGEAACDIEVFSDELHTLDSILCCQECGNIDIEEKAWIYVNSSVFNERTDDVECWCGQCKNTCYPVTVKQYLDDTDNK